MKKNSGSFLTLARVLMPVALLAAIGAMSSCDCECCKTPTTVTKKDNDTTPPPPVAADAQTKPDATYVVRGKIIDLPDPARATSEFVVHHEAIDNFVNAQTNQVVGMGSMEMPFPLAKDVKLEGLQVGDVVEITFEDFYKPSRKYQVIKVTKLPAETALEFRAAKPVK